MSVEQASGVILRTRLLTETSLLVHWLTAEHGRVATVAKGARRPKSPFRGKLDLFYEAELSFVRRRRSDLHVLREVVLRQTHPRLRADLASLRQASYAALLVQTVTEPETPVPETAGLFSEFLAALDAGNARPQLLLAFELKLLAISGQQPDFARTALRAGAGDLAKALLTQPLGVSAQQLPARPHLVELARFLHGFLIYHLGRLPRGRAAALALSPAPGTGTAAPSAAAPVTAEAGRTSANPRESEPQP